MAVKTRKNSKRRTRPMNETRYQMMRRTGHTYRAIRAKTNLPTFTAEELRSEVWAEVPEGVAPCRLEASNLGRLRDYQTKRVLSVNIQHSGYIIAFMPNGARPRTMALAPLIWAAWAGSPATFREGWDIDHIDGDKTNNRPQNLRLLSHSRNTARGHRPVVHRGTVYPSSNAAARALGVCGETIARWIEEDSKPRWGGIIRRAGYTPDGEPIRFADELRDVCDGLTVRT